MYAICGTGRGYCKCGTVQNGDIQITQQFHDWTNGIKKIDNLHFHTLMWSIITMYAGLIKVMYCIQLHTSVQQISQLWTLPVLLFTGFCKITILQLGYNFVFSISYCCYIITTIFNSSCRRWKDMVYCDWADCGWQGIVFLLTGIESSKYCKCRNWA